jgi:hypothetical protein
MKHKKPRRKTIETILPSGKTKKQTFNLDDPLDQPLLITLDCDRINNQWDSLDDIDKQILQALIKDTDLVGEPPNLRKP